MEKIICNCKIQHWSLGTVFGKQRKANFSSSVAAKAFVPLTCNDSAFQVEQHRHQNYKVRFCVLPGCSGNCDFHCQQGFLLKRHANREQGGAG
jgi:hypothetical protein